MAEYEALQVLYKRQYNQQNMDVLLKPGEKLTPQNEHSINVTNEQVPQVFFEKWRTKTPVELAQDTHIDEPASRIAELMHQAELGSGEEDKKEEPPRLAPV